MYDTHLTVTGNLTADPLRRRTPEGTSVVSFRIASTARKWHKEREEWVDGDTVYVTVKCWRVVADRVHGELRRGHSVIVTGRLSTKEWESDGQRQQRYELEADAIGPNMGKHEVLVREREQSRQSWPSAEGRPEAASHETTHEATPEAIHGATHEGAPPDTDGVGDDDRGRAWVGASGPEEPEASSPGTYSVRGESQLAAT